MTEPYKTPTPFEKKIEQFPNGTWSRYLKDKWWRFNTLPDEIQVRLLEYLATAADDLLSESSICRQRLKILKKMSDEKIIAAWELGKYL